MRLGAVPGELCVLVPRFAACGSQEGIDPLWKDLGSKIEEQVVGKYEVKESQRKADKGRGEQRRWRVHAEENKYKPGELLRKLLGSIFLLTGQSEEGRGEAAR